MKKRIALLVFDDVEVLDFAGPFEVFSVTNELNGFDFFEVQLVSVGEGAIRAKNGLSVNSDTSIDKLDAAEFVVIPGGFGTRALLRDDKFLNWVKGAADSAEQILSICTGSLLLGAIGLLDGLKATTHHQALGRLKEIAPGAEVLSQVRYADNGKVITAAGISAGIDASLHVVRKHYGEEVALKTAKYMEYEWTEYA